jgi:methylenetetrahydrofolate reductase (NADPH)
MRSVQTSQGDRSEPGAADPVRDFMRACSIELTRPTPGDLAGVRDGLGADARVYLTAVPGRPLNELADAAAEARRLGLVPVPHIAARHFESLSALARFLRALAAGGAIECVMLIGGDGPPRSERLRDARSVLESRALSDAGVRSVGLAGFPDGHPALGEDELELALVTKIAAAQNAGLEPYVVTQFAPEIAPIRRWLLWLRDRGVRVPVRIGVAGPTDLMRWLAYARRCGVRASAEALASRSGLARHAFRSIAPDLVIREAATQWVETLGPIEPHVFAFGGAAQTSRWVRALRDGRFALNADGGFDLLGSKASKSDPHGHEHV